MLSSLGKYHIIVVTTAGKGHLLPMLSMADTMLSVDPQVCVTIIVPQAPDTEMPISEKAQVRVLPFSIPPESQGPGMHTLVWLAENEDYLCRVLHELVNEMVKEDALFPPPQFLLYDMFATYTQDVAIARNMPHGLCCTSPLFFLYAWVNRACLAPPHLLDTTPAPVSLPGLGDIPKSAMPDDSGLPAIFENVVNRFKTTKVALVNDCEILYCPESRGNRSLLAQAAELAITGTGETTPVYCTGMWASKDARLSKLMNDNDSTTDCSSSESDPVIAWLDSQKDDSVVFVALGSWCPMPEADICELARGLEASGQPFLWAYRPNAMSIRPPHSPVDWTEPQPREKLTSVGLPEGFEEGVKGKSLVTRWVDQPRILTHPSIAAFVTHCGWNSLTEALTLCGKPLIALPLNAEQHMNCWAMTELFRLGKRLWEPEWPRCLDRDSVAQTINEVLADVEMKARVAEVNHLIRDSWRDTGYSANQTRLFFENHIYKS